MTPLELAWELGHEEVLIIQDPLSGLRAVIAIHDTTLGPAAGGTRMRIYPSLDDAVVDALRLSRAMTYKAVMAGVPRGGGKGVIVGDPMRDKTRLLLSTYAKGVERLGGRFHTGPDMGIEAGDVAVMARFTEHVSHSAPWATLDSADLTALGVLEAIRATARFLGRNLADLHVAIQGLGQVGSRLARLLAAEKARLTVADLEPERVEQAVAELGASRVDPEAVYDTEADVFSPNAAGGILNDATIPRLRCRAVVGAANEQLAFPRHGDSLHARGILFGPDYVVNAGGLLSLLLEVGETDEEAVIQRVRGIGGTLSDLLDRASTQGVPPHRLADRIVEERLSAARRAHRGSDVG